MATVKGKFTKGLQLNGGESFIETPIENMGPTNSASFWVKMDLDAEGEQILFESDMPYSQELAMIIHLIIHYQKIHG